MFVKVKVKNWTKSITVGRYIFKKSRRIQESNVGKDSFIISNKLSNL